MSASLVMLSRMEVLVRLEINQSPFSYVLANSLILADSSDADSSWMFNPDNSESGAGFDGGADSGTNSW